MATVRGVAGTTSVQSSRRRVLVQLLRVNRDARIENWIELVTIGPAQEQLYNLLNLIRRIHLRAIQRRLQVMQLIRIGLFGKPRVERAARQLSKVFRHDIEKRLASSTLRKRVRGISTPRSGLTRRQASSDCALPLL